MVAQGLAVLIATRGRPDILQALLRRLATQTRPPDHVIVVATEAADLAGIEPSPELTLRLGRPGLAAQRNEALQIAGSRFATLIFFDDDFVPSGFWLQRAEALFGRDAGLVALTGRVLADGVKTAGIPLASAERLVTEEDSASGRPKGLTEGVGPYGCNMAFRTAALGDLRFDERLPLYAWLEDKDFGARMARQGRVARADELWGVHLGHKTGRVSGLRLGYSQIANPVYLARKGTVSAGFSAQLMTKNIIANALRALPPVRSLAPEPAIDRAGRLRGNLTALGDILRGRVTPERAERL